jgi:hypothetical protein
VSSWCVSSAASPEGRRAFLVLAVRTFNAVDIYLKAHLPRGAQLSGNIDVGNSINLGGLSGPTAGIAHTNNGAVIVNLNNPNTRYCDSAPPYLTQLKMNGFYPLPWDTQASAMFQVVARHCH